MKKILAILLAVFLLAGALFSCTGTTDPNGDLKKGTIEKTDAEEESVWKAVTPAARAELDEQYEEKLAETKALAEVPAVSGNTYYISSRSGDDSNSGTSPEQAWKSPSKASAANSGDAVLFERGSIFRRSTNETFLTLKSGVTYATYGEGNKPIFYGSINASSETLWENVGTNLYRYKNKLLVSNDDIGSIVFNGGKAWGIKVQMAYKISKDDGTRAYKAYPLTGVSNGLQTGLSVSGDSDLRTGNDLKGPDLSFYHDTQYLYLYCEGGNPAKRFSSIELSRSKYAFSGDGVSNVTILNLDFRNYGDHVIRTVDCVNLTVKNCSFSFVGGTIQSKYGGWRKVDTRLGNAVENWDSCNGMVIENCYFNQMYDTAMTTQSNSAVSTKNVTYRNNVAENMWFGVELWTVSDGVEFDIVDVSGNYFRGIGQGFCTQRPDKNEEGYSINAFIKISSQNHQMTNFSVTDNIVDGTNGKMVFCLQLKTKDNPNGVLFDRNTYVGVTKVDFARYFGKKAANGKTYSYTSAGIAAVRELGVETNSTFYYTTSFDQKFEYDGMVKAMPLYTYKAANGVTLPFRIFFPTGYTEGSTYPLVTYLNIEAASGRDNLQNVTHAKQIISKMIEEDQAIVLVPQCPGGTWTGLSVTQGNYSTSAISETDVMKAVAALIRDVSNEYKAGKKYAVGADAGAYAVSDLLVRHKDLLTAGIIIAGAGDPSASIGSAKVMIIHAENDDVIPSDTAIELAEAWGAEYKLYQDWNLLHDCWDYAAENEDLLGWLLSK